MSTKQKDNQTFISGIITSDLTYNHEIYGEKFYSTELSAKRASETEDVIPIIVSERLINETNGWKGKFVKVCGQLRTYNKQEGERSRLILSVFAKEFEEIGEVPFSTDENSIFLQGYICKTPNYRETPLGREIADLFLAVHRDYGKSDYIPCVVWGRNARFAGNLEVGTRIQVRGRIQSREYRKKISDTEYETRVAYEVSASTISVVENTDVVETEETSKA